MPLDLEGVEGPIRRAAQSLDEVDVPVAVIARDDHFGQPTLDDAEPEHASFEILIRQDDPGVDVARVEVDALEALAQGFEVCGAEFAAYIERDGTGHDLLGQHAVALHGDLGDEDTQRRGQ